MRYIVLVAFLTLTFQAFAPAQEEATILNAFFQKRLSGDSHQAVPSFDELMQAVDTISNSDPKDLIATLPLLSASLKSNRENLPVEAALALFAISQRADAGTLLRSRVPEIGGLLQSGDERMSGGALIIFQHLMPSIPESIVPILIKHLSSPRNPTTVTANVAGMLLEYRKDDPQVMKTIEAFLFAKEDPKVQITMLQAIGNARVSTPAIDEFTLRSFEQPDRFVKIAALHAAHSLGYQVWIQAQPAVSRLASDPAEDAEVRQLANQELKNQEFSTPLSPR